MWKTNKTKSAGIMATKENLKEIAELTFQTTKFNKKQ